LIRGRPQDKNVSDWVERFLHSKEYLDQIKSAAAGIGMSNVNAQKLGAIQLPLPPAPERNRIIAKLDSLLGRSKV
jgi:type I restriction enzyme S subunit